MKRRAFIASSAAFIVSSAAGALIASSPVYAQNLLKHSTIEKIFMNSIKDKVIVITGASSGLGEATARLLATKGARLVLAARRLERLQQLAADIIKAGGQAIAVKTDVSNRSEVDNLIKTAQKQFAAVDVLFANAGIMPQAPLYKVQVDEWDNMIDVNIKGVLYSIAAVLPIMRERRAGHIINMSSVAGLKVASGRATVYSATKFAVKAISEGLREEVAEEGIRVTCLYPGAIQTELVNSINDKESRAAVQAFYDSYGNISADAVARAVVYALEQPTDVAINDISIRPSRQVF